MTFKAIYELLIKNQADKNNSIPRNIAYENKVENKHLSDPYKII